MKRYLWCLLGVLCAFSARADFISDIQNKGSLSCGVDFESKTMASLPDKGMELELCQMISESILGEKASVKLVDIEGKNRFELLRNKEVDVLLGMSTKSLKKESLYETESLMPYFFSDIKFLTFFDANKKSLEDFKRESVCVYQIFPVLMAVDRVNKAKNLDLKIIPVPGVKAAEALLKAKQCSLYANYEIALKSEKLGTLKNVAVFPDSIGRVSFAPVIRQEDKNAKYLINALISALFFAEEKGITSQNIFDFQSQKDIELMSFLGKTDNVATSLGLSKRIFFKEILKHGNYAELYQRTIATPFQIKRGINKLYKDKGVFYSPSFY